MPKPFTTPATVGVAPAFVSLNSLDEEIARNESSEKLHGSSEPPATDLTNKHSDANLPVPKWQILCLGQLVSLLYAMGGATQSSLALECNFSAPTITAGLLYLGCASLLFPLYIWRTRFKKSKRHYPHKFLGCIPIQGTPWAYFWMGFLDLEGGFFNYLSMRYTTLSNATLLFSLSTPASMVFSRCLLSRRYTKVHLIGVFVCMVGTSLVVWQDYVDESKAGEDDPYPHRMYGNAMALMAGVMLGLNDVICEKAVRHFGGDVEYVGMSGFFAAFIAIFQSALLEQDALQQLFHGTDEGECGAPLRFGLVGGFVLSQVAAYAAAARFLQCSESALLGLSSLTENMWAAGFSVLVQHIFPAPLYWVALCLTVIGIALYETAVSPIAELYGDAPTVVELSSDFVRSETTSLLAQKNPPEKGKLSSVSSGGTADESSADDIPDVKTEPQIRPGRIKRARSQEREF
uniref:EamA domain-containing protein n=1 Tax=Amphora coffeiformis TaxID=265554 RepID=A0A7S3L779_9STRA|eukprot:scaffold2209_cov168-Amphora_coffeaeformis.AAC.11